MAGWQLDYARRMIEELLRHQLGELVIRATHVGGRDLPPGRDGDGLGADLRVHRSQLCDRLAGRLIVAIVEQPCSG